ncbi:MAG: RNA 2',3'-cyclic phosphodiesterase [Oligoflexia bacterium]|nr:RNA 2',3'-cyclic phosphodiesterase [Oligoflexia bacterium]
MIRLFVTIDIPEETKDEISQIQIGLPSAKWTSRDQMHLTLRFIGEVDGREFKEIASLLSEIEFTKFTIQLKGLGTFETKGVIRTFWVGVKKNEELFSLQRKIERKLVQFGLPIEERKFFPHITLARLNTNQQNIQQKHNIYPSNNSVGIGMLIEEHNLYCSNVIEVNQFHLYSSKLTPKQSIYRKEYSFLLC